MFDSIARWNRLRKVHKTEKKHHKEFVEAMERACELYQVCEYNGELWLTYSDNLICPASMLKPAPVDAVNDMRSLYVARRNRKKRNSTTINGR